MSWDNEAHRSTGGLGFNGLRLQGKIEGNVNKLSAELEIRSPVAEARSCFSGSESKREASISPPPPPVVTKRRRYMALSDDGEAEEIGTGNRRLRRRLARKLGDDFDSVASENDRNDVSETGKEGKSRRLERSYDDDAVMKVVEEANKSNSKGKKAKAGRNSTIKRNKNPVSGNEVRTSPRFAKRECESN